MARLTGYPRESSRLAVDR